MLNFSSNSRCTFLKALFFGGGRRTFGPFCCKLIFCLVGGQTEVVPRILSVETSLQDNLPEHRGAACAHATKNSAIP